MSPERILAGNAVDNVAALNKSVIRVPIKIGPAARPGEAWHRGRVVAGVVARRSGRGGPVRGGGIAYPFGIDETDRLDRHRDVARSSGQDLAGTAAEHFHAVGLIEGRGFRLVFQEDAPPAKDSAAGSTRVQSATP